MHTINSHPLVSLYTSKLITIIETLVFRHYWNTSGLVYKSITSGSTDILFNKFISYTQYNINYTNVTAKCATRLHRWKELWEEYFVVLWFIGWVPKVFAIVSRERGTRLAWWRRKFLVSIGGWIFG